MVKLSYHIEVVTENGENVKFDYIDS